MAGGTVDERDARVVVEWITGRPRSFRRAVFCAPGASAGRVAVTLGADDVLLVPDALPVETAARVIGYRGAFDDIGDMLHVAGHAIELQHYASAAYVELVGPTAMRFFDLDGWRAFLDDADLARDAGDFAGPLVDPRLRLADAGTVDAPFDVAPPKALHVHADGRITAGAQGERLGAVDTAVDDLWASRPRWTALTGVVAETVVVDGLGSRSWLARYLRAAQVWGVLGIRPGEGRIDGFGWSADAASEGDAQPGPDDAFLVETAGGVLLADLRTRRRQRLSDLTARVVATLQTSSDPNRATERLARMERIPETTAAQLCAEAAGRLGVRAGVPLASQPARSARAVSASPVPGPGASGAGPSATVVLGGGA